MRSGVVLDRIAVEILEKNVVAPSLLYLRDLVGSLFGHILRIYTLRHAHHLEGIRFQEESEGTSAHFFTSYLFATHNTVRSRLEKPSRVNLCGLSQLEGKHISGNADLGDISEAIFGIEAACF